MGKHSALRLIGSREKWKEVRSLLLNILHDDKVVFSCCHWLPVISIFDGNYVAGVYPGAGMERRNISSLIVEVEEILSLNGKGLLFAEMQSLSANTVELLRLRSPGFEQKNFVS